MRWLMHGFDSFLHHAFAWTGTFNESGGWYGFWSGFAGGFGILTIVIIGIERSTVIRKNVGELVITISS